MLASFDLFLGIQSKLSLLYPNNVIWNIKNLVKSSLTHILLAEKETTKKVKIYKTFVKLRFTKINSREKCTDSQFAKLNLREIIKKWLAKINPPENFSP